MPTETRPIEARPWVPSEAQRHRNTAENCLCRHDHGNDRSQLARENCGACCLGGYRPRVKDDEWPKDAPNYAGWVRIYIEAGRSIPPRFARAFVHELSPGLTDNSLYRDACLRSLATYGIPGGLSTEQQEQVKAALRAGLTNCPDRMNHHVGHLCDTCGNDERRDGFAAR